MLNQDQLEYLPERITQRLEAVNQHFLQMIGDRIKEIGSMSATDIHRLEQMKAVGADLDKITAELAAISGKNAAEIKEIFDIVAADDVKFSEKVMGSSYVPYAENKALRQYVAALSAQSVADYVNMSRNTAFMGLENGQAVVTSMSKAYTDIIDDAITAVTTGQTDFYSAVRDSLKRFADSGIRTKYSPLKGAAGKTADYASGYSRRLDSAVRQNLLWGAKQCNQGVQEQVGEEFGADGWEIDYHSCPRPSHVEMGGGQYAAGNKGKTIDGVYYPPFSEVEGLLADYGCLHRKWPILLGISEPNHSASELKKLKADDEKEIEFEGQKYSKYEMKQIQRKLESAARNAKDRQIIAKAAGDDELRRQEQAKINLITSKYAQVSRAAGLPTKTERMSVSKYHRVGTTAKSGSVAKTVQKTKLTPELESKLREYTAGKYGEICDYSQYLVDKNALDVSSLDWFEKNRLSEITESSRSASKQIMSLIDESTTKNESLYRLERRSSASASVGDTVKWGIRSTSADREFVDRVIGNMDEGFNEGGSLADSEIIAKFQNSIVYKIEGKTKSLNIEKYSDFDQAERLTYGEFKISKIEEIKYVSPAKQTFDEAIKSNPANFEYFTSKKGNEMVRDLSSGQTWKASSSGGREFVDGKLFTSDMQYKEDAKKASFWNHTEITIKQVIK